MRQFSRLAALIVFSVLFGCADAGSPSGDTGPTGIQGIVSTFAGSAALSGVADSPFYTAYFNTPRHAACDGTNLYVADYANSTIRKIVLSTGAVSTVAGSAGVTGSTDATGSAARFANPRGVATDGVNLYVADTGSNKIRQILISTGAVTTLAGSGASGSANGAGAAATFSMPSAIACDGTNLWVADSANHLIRQIVISSGEVTTLAGTAGASGTVDDTGSAARFNYPIGITLNNGALYVADMSNRRIRKIVIATAAVTTFAGSTSGSADGVGIAAQFNTPYGITTDGTSLYVADGVNETLRRIVISTAAVTTLAGSAGSSGSVDGTGSAARFSGIFGVARNGGDLYVVESTSCRVRKVVASTGVVTAFAGQAGQSGSADATSPGCFNGPEGITADATHLFVMDQPSSTLRRIDLDTANVKTLAGAANSAGSTDATGSLARFNLACDVAYDGTNLYVADTSNHTIRMVVPSTGAVTTLAGTAGASGTADGTGAAARFLYPMGIAGDGTNLYVADWGNHTIRKIVIATAEVSTLAGLAGVSGTADATGGIARFYQPQGIVRDGDALYVADSSNNTIRKVETQTAVVTTVAGTPGTSGTADGTGTAAQFSQPRYVACDGTNLYVTENNNHTVRKIVMSTGVVTTLAGSAGNSGTADGTGAAARFTNPRGIVYGGGKLYVADAGNSCIRVIR
jgi:hypothetical protein